MVEYKLENLSFLTARFRDPLDKSKEFLMLKIYIKAFLRNIKQEIDEVGFFAVQCLKKNNSS
jgi:hypothetical protein